MKESLLNKKSVAIVGSGQSAAEIFHDLLQHEKHFTKGLHWYTRSSRFFPMDYSKLTLEMTSPDYIQFFYNLQPLKKEMLLREQDMLYKGINYSLINDIYDQLYLQSLSKNASPKTLSANTVLQQIQQQQNGEIALKLFHSLVDKSFTVNVEAVILATGYKSKVPAFLYPVKELINWLPGNKYDVAFNYSIDKKQTIFIQNAELHSHGFNAADLGMGPYRNAIIINTILGYEHFKIENNIAFQSFGIPE